MADSIADAGLDNVALQGAAAKELAKELEPQLRAMEHSGAVDHTVMVIKFRYGRSRTPK